MKVITVSTSFPISHPACASVIQSVGVETGLELLHVDVPAESQPDLGPHEVLIVFDIDRPPSTL